MIEKQFGELLFLLGPLILIPCSALVVTKISEIEGRCVVLDPLDTHVVVVSVGNFERVLYHF